MLDAGDVGCLPVVAAMLNPELEWSYDSIDMQHVLAQSHWYVSGYSMSFTHPVSASLATRASHVWPWTLSALAGAIARRSRPCAVLGSRGVNRLVPHQNVSSRSLQLCKAGHGGGESTFHRYA
eukprot:scaffold263002_cov31-Tisochrysis_lutea.AAC.3